MGPHGLYATDERGHSADRGADCDARQERRVLPGGLRTQWVRAAPRKVDGTAGHSHPGGTTGRDRAGPRDAWGPHLRCQGLVQLPSWHLTAWDLQGRHCKPSSGKGAHHLPFLITVELPNCKDKKSFLGFCNEVTTCFVNEVV